MKRVGLLILLFFTAFIRESEAQLITYRKEIIFIDDKPYAYLFKKGSIWAKVFSLQSLKNEAVMEAKPILKEMDGGYDFVYYEISFKGTDKKAEIEDGKNFDLRLAHELGVFEVLQNDEINLAGIQKFIEKYPNNISKKFDNPAGEKPNPKPTEPKPELVAREDNLKKLNLDQAIAANGIMPLSNAKPLEAAPVAATPVVTKAPVLTKVTIVPGLKINGSAILKSGKPIGKFTSSEQYLNDKLKKTYAIYNAKNIKIATASYADPKSGTCKIYCSKDKKTRTITTANDGGNLKVITSWLVQNRYL